MTKLKTSQLYRVTKTQTPLGRYLIFQFTLTDPDPNELRVQKMRLQLQGLQ